MFLLLPGLCRQVEYVVDIDGFFCLSFCFRRKIWFEGIHELKGKYVRGR